MILNYGSVLKVKNLTYSSGTEVDTVMLVNNITAGNGYNCKVLDLSSYEILADFESIDDFKNKVEIVEVLDSGNKKDIRDMIIGNRTIIMSDSDFTELCTRLGNDNDICTHKDDLCNNASNCHECWAKYLSNFIKI